MYELFILGELKEGPMHGYLLHRILSNMIGPLRQISWGTLYSVLRRLETDGYISQMAEQSGGPGRTRKLYEITQLGSSQFDRLMRQPFEHNHETEDLFRIKLSNFHHIAQDMQLDIMRQYKTFLEIILGAVDVSEQQIQDNGGISDEERPQIQQVIDYERTVHEAKLAWVETRIERMTAGR